jgi:hypothetical protein
MLPPLLTLARTGATQRAWEAFLAAGLEGVNTTEALTLKGRLLKDRARQAAGAERSALFAQSGAAYAAAASLRPDSYPLINAAAMALFAGDVASAESIARDVLTLIDGDPSQGETPYWREATRAEALLLLGREQDARASLAAAIARAPQAWEDHASTLRQFAAILQEIGSDPAWLDAHRPAPSLHYSGILGLAHDDALATEAINAAIATIAPGAAYGALAAGADIIAAEAILGLGAELHIILPSNAVDFRAASVAPFGEPWLARYDAVLAAATSLTLCSQNAGPSRASVALADYQAMGMAAERAMLLEARAIALRIAPDGRSAQDDPWLLSGRELVHLPVATSATGSPPAGLPDGTVTFLLSLAGDADRTEASGFASMDEMLDSLPAGEVTAAMDCRADGRHGNVSALLRNATPGTIIASMAAAMALLAEGRAARVEPLGEMETGDGPTRVYAVKLLNRP